MDMSPTQDELSPESLIQFHHEEQRFYGFKLNVYRKHGRKETETSALNRIRHLKYASQTKIKS